MSLVRISASKIIDGLFIGNKEASQDIDFIVSNKISSIVNSSGNAGFSFNTRDLFDFLLFAFFLYFWILFIVVAASMRRLGCKYLTYRWADSSTTVMFDPKGKVIKQIFTFIEEAFDSGESVLVNSVDGNCMVVKCLLLLVSARACCVVLAYLVFKFKWSIGQALAFVSSRRPEIEPRQYFIKQLKLAVKFLGLNDDENIVPVASVKWQSNPESTLSELVVRNTFLNNNQLVVEADRGLIKVPIQVDCDDPCNCSCCRKAAKMSKIVRRIHWSDDISNLSAGFVLVRPPGASYSHRVESRGPSTPHPHKDLNLAKTKNNIPGRSPRNNESLMVSPRVGPGSSGISFPFTAHSLEEQHSLHDLHDQDEDSDDNFLFSKEAPKTYNSSSYKNEDTLVSNLSLKLANSPAPSSRSTGARPIPVASDKNGEVKDIPVRNSPYSLSQDSPNRSPFSEDNLVRSDSLKPNPFGNRLDSFKPLHRNSLDLYKSGSEGKSHLTNLDLSKNIENLDHETHDAAFTTPTNSESSTQFKSFFPNKIIPPSYSRPISSSSRKLPSAFSNPVQTSPSPLSPPVASSAFPSSSFMNSKITPSLRPLTASAVVGRTTIPKSNAVPSQQVSNFQSVSPMQLQSNSFNNSNSNQAPLPGSRPSTANATVRSVPLASFQATFSNGFNVNANNNAQNPVTKPKVATQGSGNSRPKSPMMLSNNNSWKSNLNSR